jgi:hypothetical protein
MPWPFSTKAEDVVRLCMDCKYYLRGHDASTDRCTMRRIDNNIDLIRGGSTLYGPRHVRVFCYSTRTEPYCGREGRWWEAK